VVVAAGVGSAAVTTVTIATPQLYAENSSSLTKTGFFCKFIQNHLKASVVTSNKPRKHLKKTSFESMGL
jgi:hypothetical protein